MHVGGSPAQAQKSLRAVRSNLPGRVTPVPEQRHFTTGNICATMLVPFARLLAHDVISHSGS